ncbi:ABC transporter permease [Paenibacillus sp. FSL L8-0641]|uniref:ABC transporter permease n=1 Tax=Paenibacillus sp. FSL L8-0641 TaxID=2921605 RepID=UPI0030F67EF4
MRVIFLAIWNYRNFVIGMVKRDFRSRYLNSVLGSAWAVLNPLAIIIVYTVIFSQVMKSRLPGVDDTLTYSVYLCASLLPWLYFTETIQRTMTVFIDNGSLIKKVNFPKATLPIFILIASTINFVIIYALFIAFLLIIGRLPGIEALGIIPLLIAQQLIAVGLGLFIGSINVFFRDAGQVMGIILQFWFWFTPVVYSIQILPDKVKNLFSLNILVPIIEGYQNIYLQHSIPDMAVIFKCLFVGLICLFIGYITFKRLGKEMVDEL